MLAGIFMLVMGLSMLGIFPSLRKFRLRLPASLGKLVGKAVGSGAGPFAVGFLNGYMPCGPLQAMWLLAFAASHPLYGALSMLAFSLGTLPLMLGGGSLVSVLKKKYTGVVMKVGAVLVVVMALSMMSQGMALGNWKGNGTLSLVGEKKAASGKDIVMEDGKQVVKSKLNPYWYPDITVRKGIPVHWEIEADESSLNGCNYKMIFRDLGFMYTMNFGSNVIEFTPEKSGRIDYTCWMGMVRGSITVED